MGWLELLAYAGMLALMTLMGLYWRDSVAAPPYLRTITYTPAQTRTDGSPLPAYTFTLVDEKDCGTGAVLARYYGARNAGLQAASLTYLTSRVTSCWELRTIAPGWISSAPVWGTFTDPLP